MEPYIPTGMLRSQVSFALIVVGVNGQQQLTADNGAIASMRMQIVGTTLPGGAFIVT